MCPSGGSKACSTSNKVRGAIGSCGEMDQDALVEGCLSLHTWVTITSGSVAVGDGMRLLCNRPDFFAKLWAVAARYFVM